ncbi:hypothetical protein PHLCEN_2v2195 [Hermanssonia centrifuga]|uniref:C2H2-type domain-containing protein n=1 Tax=Hermanssonia centrifuga TaxID=98765 RepID=A0A2R6RPU2_9APHY|nr:hypothetical protein PHLCEN_2v2195 [Hermanssonia centrifuga]
MDSDIIDVSWPPGVPRSMFFVFRATPLDATTNDNGPQYSSIGPEGMFEHLFRARQDADFRVECLGGDGSERTMTTPSQGSDVTDEPRTPLDVMSGHPHILSHSDGEHYPGSSMQTIIDNRRHRASTNAFHPWHGHPQVLPRGKLPDLEDHGVQNATMPQSAPLPSLPSPDPYHAEFQRCSSQDFHLVTSSREMTCSPFGPSDTSGSVASLDAPTVDPQQLHHSQHFYPYQPSEYHQRSQYVPYLHGTQAHQFLPDLEHPQHLGYQATISHTLQNQHRLHWNYGGIPLHPQSGLHPVNVPPYANAQEISEYDPQNPSYGQPLMQPYLRSDSSLLQPVRPSYYASIVLSRHDPHSSDGDADRADRARSSTSWGSEALPLAPSLLHPCPSSSNGPQETSVLSAIPMRGFNMDPQQYSQQRLTPPSSASSPASAAPPLSFGPIVQLPQTQVLRADSWTAHFESLEKQKKKRLRSRRGKGGKENSNTTAPVPPEMTLPVQHPCPLCERTFERRNGLAIHLKWHYKSEENPNSTIPGLGIIMPVNDANRPESSEEGPSSILLPVNASNSSVSSSENNTGTPEPYTAPSRTGMLSIDNLISSNDSVGPITPLATPPPTPGGSKDKVLAVIGERTPQVSHRRWSTGQKDSWWPELFGSD